MKNSLLYIALLLLCCCRPGTEMLAQNSDPACTQLPGSGQTYQLGSVVINNGSAVRLKKSGIGGKYTTNIITGLTVVGEVGTAAHDTSVYYGFWGQLIGAPVAPYVVATQGELKDRIQVSWALDPLSSAASGGFKIFRDGIFIAEVSAGTSNWIDFNIIAGRPYTYSVRAVNEVG